MQLVSQDNKWYSQSISQQAAGKIKRNDLLDSLSSCPAGIFCKVVFYLELPAGTLSSERNSQAKLASELIEWAEHNDEIGIVRLHDAYLRAIGKRKV